MGRRHGSEEHVNHEAWAIPYGDLVTLLMAFFVVMYAISSVDAGKYRVLSNSLVEAFGNPGRVPLVQVGDPTLVVGEDQPRTLAPVDLPADPTAGGEQPDAPDAVPTSPADRAVQGGLDAATEAQRQALRAEIAGLASAMEGALAPQIADQLIKITRESYWLEIEINTSMLFPSGSATLDAQARPMLAQVAAILSRQKGRIHVEGHTDNVPISNPVYPSNWELSSGRAANVVSLFAQQGVDPQRMVAIGYGEFQPAAGNETPEDRARNRRVSIVVLPGSLPRSGERLEPERLREDYPQPPTDGSAPGPTRPGARPGSGPVPGPGPANPGTAGVGGAGSRPDAPIAPGPTPGSAPASGAGGRGIGQL